MKHKHYDMIVEWANDTTKKVEYWYENHKGWCEISAPTWNERFKYRFARPEWQKRLIDAAKSGRVVEVRYYDDDPWEVTNMNEVGDKYDFGWAPEKSYRLKPRILKAWAWVDCGRILLCGDQEVAERTKQYPNIKFTQIEVSE